MHTHHFTKMGSARTSQIAEVRPQLASYALINIPVKSLWTVVEWAALRPGLAEQMTYEEGVETWAWPVVLVGREGPVPVVGVQRPGRQVAQGLPALQELLQRA